MKKLMQKKILNYIVIGLLIFSYIIVPDFISIKDIRKIDKEKYSQEFLKEYYSNIEKMLSNDSDSERYFNEIIIDLNQKEATKDGEQIDISQELQLNVNDDYSNLDSELKNSIYEYSYIDNDKVKVTSPYQTERLIVTTDNLGNTYNATNIVKMPYESYLLQYDNVVDTKEAYEELSKDNNIEDVSPDTLLKLSSDEELNIESTSDSHNSWGYNTMGFNYMESAVNDFGKQEETIVAVIDTGCNINHEVFNDRIINSYNAAIGGTDVTDTQGHGTHVSGIIADSTDQNIKIMPIKVMDNSGKMYKSAEIAAIIYAAQNDADVINISLGSSDYAEQERKAISDAKDKGIIVCAAAGNSNIGTTEYPAAYDEAIAVASIDNTLAKSYFSNYGAKIDFTAPGSSIYSASNINNTDYVYMSGTSMASPHIAAAAGMIKSVKNQFTFDEVYNILRKYSVDIGTEGKDIYFGWGYINFKSVDICECGSPNCHTLYCDGCEGKYAVNCNFCLLKNFENYIDGSNIVITKYIGTDVEYFLPKTIKKDGVYYNVVSQISFLERVGNNDYIQFIKPETQIQLIMNTYNDVIKITNNDSEEITEGIISTGLSIELQGDIIKKIVVNGDLDGNGKITVTDLSRLNQHLIGNITLADEYYKAADLDNSTKVSITDLSKLNQYIVGDGSL